MIVGVVAVVAIAVMAFGPTVSGMTSARHRDDSLRVSTTPSGTALLSDTILITAIADGRVRGVMFSAEKGRCKLHLGTVQNPPYTVSWKPETARCGAGKYEIEAKAIVSARGKDEAETKITILAAPPPEPILVSNDAYDATTTSTGYPPEPGTSSSQTFATIQLPATTTPNQQFRITLDLAGIKASGGGQNLDYRVFDQTTSAVLLSGSIPAPTEMTSATGSATLTVPTVGEQHTLLFQFRSSQLFSAVTLHSFSIRIE